MKNLPLCSMLLCALTSLYGYQRQGSKRRPGQVHVAPVKGLKDEVFSFLAGETSVNFIVKTW